MTRVLLDSDVVVDFFKGFPPTMSLIRQLFLQRNGLCTCSVVVAEVYAGLSPNERIGSDVLFESMTFLPETPIASRQAGIWRYEFARRGQQLATTDCLIAAIAHEHGATLLTGNVNHFPMDEVHLLPVPRRPPESKDNGSRS